MAEALTRALYDALEVGDAEAVRRALREGADPDRKPELKSYDVVHVAAHVGRFDDRRALIKVICYMSHNSYGEGADPVACCAALLEAGTSPNETLGDSMAPIFLACKPASLSVLELLIGAGADVNVSEIFRDETPLHFASKCGLSKHVAVLLAAGADVNAIPRLWGPGWAWMLYQRPRVVPMLLRAGVALPQPGTTYTVKVQRAGGIRRYEAQMKISLATIFIDKFPVGLPVAPLRTIVEFWAHAGDY